MQRGIQSAEAGQSTAEHKVCSGNIDGADGHRLFGLPEHDGNRSGQEHRIRLRNVTVLEIECLHGRGGEMIIKELAICNDACHQSYLFRPPYTLQRHRDHASICTNQWIKDHLNGLDWYDGFLEYHHVEGILTNIGHRMDDRLYTKGHEKAQLLTQLVGRPVRDLTSAPKQKSINLLPTVKCQLHYTIKHSRRYQCALEKSMKYFNWIQQQQKQQKEQEEEQEQLNKEQEEQEQQQKQQQQLLQELQDLDLNEAYNFVEDDKDNYDNNDEQQRVDGGIKDMEY